MTKLEPGTRVRVALRANPAGTWTGTVRKILEHPTWPHGADVVVDLDDPDHWRKATRNYPGRYGDPVFCRDELNPLDT